MGCTNRPVLNSKIIGLVVTWLLTRLWVLLAGFQVIKYPNGPSLFADVRLYDWWAANIQDGHFPINDPMWQYPPLAALIFLLGYLIAPSTIGFVFLALAADALIFLNIDFSAVSYWQARARIQTKDRVKEANIHWIFAKGGIEDKIYEAVMNKKDYTTYHFKKDFNI
jgi:hypothetical protein